VSASVDGPDGKRIVLIRNNYFKGDEFFRIGRPDDSALNVFDETNDAPVLHIRYLNPKAIMVTGRFSEGVLQSTFQITRLQLRQRVLC